MFPLQGLQACLRRKPTRIQLTQAEIHSNYQPRKVPIMYHKPNFGLATALSFDIYGTLIDWETGLLEGLIPLTSQLDDGHACHPLSDYYHESVVDAFNKHERRILEKNPTTLYEGLLTQTYFALADEWGVKADPEAATGLGDNIESWDAFPDTVAAMQKLGQRFKLIALSNISQSAFAKTMNGPLKDVKFDAAYLAEDIGSYKPSHNNFQYLLDHAKEDLGVKTADLVHVAHGVVTDQVPADEMGIHHVWIRRGSNETLTVGLQKGQKSYETLGELAADLLA